TCMALLSTVSSGVSVPLAEGLQLGWQLALTVWILPAALAIILWVIIYQKTKNKEKEEVVQEEVKQKADRRIWKSHLAWKIALFMGFQSTMYYVTISWLPELLMDGGMA